MSIELLELAASALDELCEEVVFVGGATVELWITDPAAPDVRPTDDVDVIVEVATKTGFYAFEDKLRARGFSEDVMSGIICRWQHGSSSLVLDAVPADPSILGFSNRWFMESISHAVERSLPSGCTIRATSPPYLIATKVEAFRSRGKGDFLGSSDFADIITLVDGRAEIVEEIAGANKDVRTYLRGELSSLMSHPRFIEGVAGSLRSDETSQRRADLVVMPRIQTIVDS